MNNLEGVTKKKGAKLPFTEDEYRRIRNVIRTSNSRHKARNLLLVNLQTNTSLRSCDVLKLKVGDVYRNGEYLMKFWLEQKKTKDQTAIFILDCILKDLEHARKEYDDKLCEDYFEHPDFALFPSERYKYENYKPISGIVNLSQLRAGLHLFLTICRKKNKLRSSS